jgi:hypothetical protein
VTNALRAGATAASAPKPTSARHVATARSVTIARRGRPVPNVRPAQSAAAARTGPKAPNAAKDHPEVQGQTCATVRPAPNDRSAASALTGPKAPNAAKAHPGVHGLTCATVRPAPNVRSAANALPAQPLAPASRRRAQNNRASSGARRPCGKPK